MAPRLFWLIGAVVLRLHVACSSDPSNSGRDDAAGESGGAGTDTAGSAGAGEGSGGNAGVSHGSGGDAGAGGSSDDDGSSGAGGEGGDTPACCGCLCADPTWSCSTDTCVDDEGRALGLAPEAGFLQIEGESYVSEGQNRNSPRHRVWYAFQPAASAPQDRPLAVLFNGGPGAATTVLFGFNTNRFTLDPDRTLGQDIDENPHRFTAFANLLYVDAPATGFSYALPMPGGLTPTVGIDLDRDAALFVRVIVRFLARHPALRKNPVILVGESYGGTRATLMLEHLFGYRDLVSAAAAYRDPPLHAELVEHFRAVFPSLDPAALEPARIATQFGAQILIQPVVAGSTQWALNTPDTSPCVPDFDANQCDEPFGWFAEQIAEVADRMTTLATLHTALGVDPTSIQWLYAVERTLAYGRSDGVSADPTEMNAVFGELGPSDNYYLSDNREVREGYDVDSRWWDDPTIGESFLRSTFHVRTFVTDARLDAFVWAPAIAPALAAYPALVTSSIHDTAPRTGVARPGWIMLDYDSASYPAPATREIRFPHYPSAGHGVTLRAPGELLSDVAAWYESGT